MTNILSLPNELLYIIFMNLGLLDAIHFKLTCKRFSVYELICDNINPENINHTIFLKIPQYRFTKPLNSKHLQIEYNYLHNNSENIFSEINDHIQYLEMKLDLLKYNQSKQIEISDKILALRISAIDILEEKIKLLEEFITAALEENNEIDV